MSGTTHPPRDAELTTSDNRLSMAWGDFFRKLVQQVALASWSIGDYRQSVRADLGKEWLVCDGSDVAQAAYPELFKLLSSITAPGATAGTFKLPNMGPGTFDDAHPAPDGSPVMRWFIRAL